MRPFYFLFLIGIFILSLSACGGGGSSSSPVSQSPVRQAEPIEGQITVARMQAVLDTAVAEGMVGLSIVIDTGNQQIELTAGFANTDSNQLMTSDHLFKIGSNTKVLVAVLTLMMIEQGELSMDDTLTDLLPVELVGNIAYADQITIEQLLSHTSGLYDYLNKSEYRNLVYSQANKQWTLDEIIEFLAAKPAENQPGSGFDYSNANYILLGKIVDELLGYPHQVAIHQQIIEPLNLSDIYYENSPQVLDLTLAAGYDNSAQFVLEDHHQYYLSQHALPDIGGYSNPKSWLSLIKKIHQQQNPITPFIYQQMTSNWLQLEPNRLYGKGLTQWQHHGSTSYGHGGSIDGYITLAEYFPEQDLGIAIFNNRTDSFGNQYFWFIKQQLFEMALKFQAQQQ